MSDSNADRDELSAPPESIFFGPSTAHGDSIDASRAPRAPHPTSPPQWQPASSVEPAPPAAPISYPGEDSTVTMPPAPRPPRQVPDVAAASPQDTAPRRSWWAPVAAGFLGAVLAVGGMQLIDAVASDDDPAPVETAAAVVVETPAVAAPSIEIPLMTEGPVVDPVAVGSTVIPSVVTVEVGSASADGFFAQGTGSG